MLRGLLSHGAYFAVVILLAMAVPAGVMHHSATAKTIFILGFLGTWRYSWALLNFTRAAIFIRFVYPRWKARRQARFDAEGAPAHAFFLVTTYMVSTADTMRCYHALFRAAARARDGASIVASVVDGADERLIRTIYDNFHEDLSRVSLTIDRIKSNGKRDALAKGLKIIAKMNPTAHDIVVFVDGDTCVPEDIVAQSARCSAIPRSAR